ncbi:UDP-4-amino-4,6-dideoxy-N-acetyl-beta-L-altrosamine N-acetyltransferase [Marinobacter algicola]|uniref:GCN5-related N-acetyltransferase n=1 Tax=Marinobacter algicola DG893 TaxID=443152 RepID=A6F1I3_9GAMM|nr:UDP-4-amino-4,6-dideoxy-N-acetyl-beta-L-altrosamine N-acetyltransferase [Marinobacter algicola]EDM47384.1 GCN5-related N-acetyltransferase [Marinobacter algicola DG893]
MEETDLERVLQWRNHPDVRRYMYTTHEISLEEHKSWFARTRSNPSISLLIFEQCGEPCGFVSIVRSRSRKIADWGFYTAPDAPKGTGRKLGQCALEYGFNELALHKLCGQALGFNESSINFHKALWFTEEGRLREQHFDGIAYHDVVCFGLLANEWQSFRKDEKGQTQ